MIQQTMALNSGALAEVTHFLIFKEEQGRLACAPQLKELSAVPGRPWPYARTDEPRAVNCPLCMKTTEFQAAIALYPGVH